MPLNQLAKLPAIALSIILGGAIYYGVEISPLDLWIQDLLFDFGRGEWLVDRNSFWPKLIFYQFIKIPLVALGCALGVGWTMGLFQMLKGAHFFHTLATMILTWILCQVI